MDKVLNESLRQNDLEFLVSPYVSVDQYTSKIKSDNITIAFFCNQLDVAKDLSDFLEKLYPIEISDIEIAETLTEDNKNIVYVELERNQMFPKILIDIINSIDFLINCDVDDWDFITFGMKNKEKLSYEALLKNVRLVPLEVEAKGIKEGKEEINESFVQGAAIIKKLLLLIPNLIERGFIKGSMIYTVKLAVKKMKAAKNMDEKLDVASKLTSILYDMQDYYPDYAKKEIEQIQKILDKFEQEEEEYLMSPQFDIDHPNWREEEGFDEEDEEVTETVQYSKDGIIRTYLDEGVITQEELDKMIKESETLNENSLDKEILEYNFPDCQVITTDNHAFIIDKEIKKLGC